MLNYVAVIDFLTVFFSILVKIIGTPDQIRLNFKRKSTKGVSTLFFAIGFISYSLWAIYGFIKHDNVIIIGQGAGVIVMAIVLWQIFIYRNNK